MNFTNNKGIKNEFFSSNRTDSEKPIAYRKIARVTGMIDPR